MFIMALQVFGVFILLCLSIVIAYSVYTVITGKDKNEVD